MTRSFLVATGMLFALAAATWWLATPRVDPSSPLPALESLGEPRRSAPPEVGLPAHPSGLGCPRQEPRSFVQGKVVAASDDRPLAGARLEARLASDGFGQPDPCDPLGTATTDSDGGFSIGPLAADPIVLTARAPGWAGWTRRLALEEREEPLTVRLEPARLLAGLVLDRASGAPVPGARVLAGLPGEGPEAVSDAQGRFFLEGLPLDGGTRLQVLSSAHEFLEHDHLPWDPQPRILLAPKPQLRVWLFPLLPKGASLPDNRIRLVISSFGKDEKSLPTGLAGSFASGGELHLAQPWPEGGELVLKSLEAGWHCLRVETLAHPVQSGATGPFHLLPGGSLTIELDLLPQPSLEGRVVDERGRPLPGIEVRASAGGDRTYTDPQGRFALSGLPSAPGILLVRRPGVAARIWALSNFQEGTTGVLGDLVLPDRTGRISGRILDSKGRPRVGALVVLATPGLPHGDWFTHSGPTGAFELYGLPWGSWEVHVWGPGSSPPLSLAGLSPKGRIELTPQRPHADLTVEHEPARMP